MGYFKVVYFDSLREANEVGTNTEAGTGARRRTYRWRIDIKDGEGSERNEGNHADLRELEALAW
jgi:hypothetical protein